MLRVPLIQSSGLAIWAAVSEVSKTNPNTVTKSTLEPLYDNANGAAATTTVLGKFGAFVKSAFKSAKFDTPADFASGAIFFLVYPFKLSEKQVADIEVRFWSGDDSKQLALVEGTFIDCVDCIRPFTAAFILPMNQTKTELNLDSDSTLIMLQAVNGVTSRITDGLYTHFWFTLNGVDMTAEEHSSCE